MKTIMPAISHIVISNYEIWGQVFEYQLPIVHSKILNNRKTT
jgi:hypothetical protein